MVTATRDEDHTVQGQVRYLHEKKGMPIKDAIREIESKIGPLPETIINQIYYEEKFWR